MNIQTQGPSLEQQQALELFTRTFVFAAGATINNIDVAITNANKNGKDDNSITKDDILKTNPYAASHKNELAVSATWMKKIAEAVKKNLVVAYPRKDARITKILLTAEKIDKLDNSEILDAMIFQVVVSANKKK